MITALLQTNCYQPVAINLQTVYCLHKH